MKKIILFFVATIALSTAAWGQTMKDTKTILIPIPRYGFDPTEVAVPWKILRSAGIKTVFATPDGKPGQADVRMVTGKDLGVLKNILRADKNGRQAYAELEASADFQKPLAYGEVHSENFDALLLPGGHDKGMREYLESKAIQNVVVDFFEAQKPVAAICHGTLLAGRSINPRTGHSVLWGRKTTGLTRRQELVAWQLTRLFLDDYYRTYPELDRGGKIVTMQDELVSYLENPKDYSPGPGFPIPSFRDGPKNLAPGFVVIDGNYISARWPGDAHRLGHEFVKLLRTTK